jgi:hypothetical protein
VVTAGVVDDRVVERARDPKHPGEITDYAADSMIAFCNQLSQS